ncbi:hypothetical protein M0R45_007896 [Rubus argutus]|uniref:Uncharacterized protein n=1 Tax=Rubus argutus TaxID=59490 RepID=A0AAW1XZQ9_RUBAR
MLRASGSAGDGVVMDGGSWMAFLWCPLLGFGSGSYLAARIALKGSARPRGVGDSVLVANRGFSATPTVAARYAAVLVLPPAGG